MYRDFNVYGFLLEACRNGMLCHSHILLALLLSFLRKQESMRLPGNLGAEKVAEGLTW